MAGLDDVLKAAEADAIAIDLSGATGGNVADGTYTFEVTECIPGVSKPSAKNPNGLSKLEWRISVVEGPHAGERGPITHTVLSGPGAGRARDFLVALGYDVSDPNVQFSPKGAIGKRFTATVVPQQSNPLYSELKNLRAVTAGSPLQS